MKEFLHTLLQVVFSRAQFPLILWYDAIVLYYVLTYSAIINGSLNGHSLMLYYLHLPVSLSSLLLLQQIEENCPKNCGPIKRQKNLSGCFALKRVRKFTAYVAQLKKEVVMN